MKNNEKKTIFISAVIIAVFILLIEMLGSFLLKNIELPKIVTYLMRVIMYIITITFAQVITQKISTKLKNNK